MRSQSSALSPAKTERPGRARTERATPRDWMTGIFHVSWKPILRGSLPGRVEGQRGINMVSICESRVKWQCVAVHGEQVRSPAGNGNFGNPVVSCLNIGHLCVGDRLYSNTVANLSPGNRLAVPLEPHRQLLARCQFVRVI